MSLIFTGELRSEIVSTSGFVQVSDWAGRKQEAAHTITGELEGAVGVTTSEIFSTENNTMSMPAIIWTFRSASLQTTTSLLTPSSAQAQHFHF